MAKGKVYPQKIYFMRGKDGKGRFFDTDPMVVRDKEAVELDLSQVLTDFFGPADSFNPLVLKIAGVINDSREKFNVSAPGRIRSGEIAKHFEDIEGNLVEVLQMRSPDVNYPVNGVVIDRKGNLVEQRLYANDGSCADGDEYHRLVIVDGPINRVKPVEAAEEEKKVEEAL